MKKVVALLLLLVMAVSLCACDSADYKEAMELYEDGRYERARAIFVELGDYENSARMVVKCDYGIAVDCLEDGDYTRARELFLELGDHEDSPEMAVKAARGMLIEYLKENEVEDRILQESIATRITESDGEVLMVYAIRMSGIVNIDVTFGASLNVEGEALLAGQEEVSNWAADWEAEAGSKWNIASYKSGDAIEWDMLDVSGYNANGTVTEDDDTLFLVISADTAVKEMTAHLEQVLEESGLGLSMADIGFDAY